MQRIAIYSPMRAWNKGDLPTSPLVHLMVGTCSKEGDHILLSPQLMSGSEIDEFVSQMKAELDEFSKVAKRELQDLKRKIIHG